MQNLFQDTNNSYLQQAGNYYTKLSDLLGSQTQYNPATDPTAQSYKAQFEQGAQQASNKNMADMNKRGILDSTITSDRSARIQQEANQGFQNLIPGLQANHHNQHQQQIGNAFNMFNSLLGAGQNEQARQEQTRQFDINTTGQYMPEGAQGLITQLLDLKRQAEQKDESGRNINQGQALQELSSQADAIRSQLKAMGISDTDALFGSGVGLSGAEQNVNKAKAPTARTQQDLFSTLLGMGNTYGSLPTGTGQSVGDLPLFSGLGDYLSGLEGKPTMDVVAEQARQAIAQQNANTSSSSSQNSNANAKINQLMDVWKNTGVAPAGLESLGVNQGDTLPEGEGKPASANDKYAEYVSYLDQMSGPDRKKFLAAEKVNIIKNLGLSGFERFMELYGDETSGNVPGVVGVMPKTK